MTEKSSLIRNLIKKKVGENMARMFPQCLPASVCRDKKRSSEVKVYEKLQATLTDDYVVFYSVAWLARGNGSVRSEDYAAWLDKPYASSYPIGEADFVILHPRKGLLVLEVKGGRLEIDSGSWYSRDRNNQLHDIHSPVEQAKKNLFALLNKLREHPKLRHCFFQTGYGVILPDCSWPEGAVNLDATASISGCHGDMAQLGQRITGIMNYWQGAWKAWRNTGVKRQENAQTCQELSAIDMKVLIDYLAPTMELKRPTMDSLIKAQQEEVVNLTEKQFFLLNTLSRQRRALISGGAGTGKTMLALEKAKRLAEAGYRTLFTCTNRLLAENLRAQVPAMENLTIINFHQLCHQWAAKAGISLPNPDGADQRQQSEEFFNVQLPEYLLQALDVVPDRFDAIVVDEGQDFFADWWAVLLLCLQDAEKGILYIFYDQNQNIWNEKADFPLDLDPFTLSENLRNTRQIHQLLEGYFKGEDYNGAGPEGGAVEYIEIGEAADKAALQSLLTELVKKITGKEKVKPSDIAILTGKRRDNSLLAGVAELSGYPLTSRTDSAGIVFTSIRRFKGMERAVVILIELDELVEEGCLLDGLKDRLSKKIDPHALAQGLLYVGLSRAQSYLYVVGRRQVLSEIRT